MLVYVVVIIALVNLSFGIGNGDLWKYLLLTFLGFFLPSPSIKGPARDKEQSSTNLIPFPLNNFDHVPPNLVGDVPDFDSDKTLNNAATSAATLPTELRLYSHNKPG